MQRAILSIVNQKGGTGKTTTAINLGVALANAGRSVLLIDLDPQGSLSYSLGVTNPEFTVTDVLESLVSANEAIVTVENEKVHLLPASIRLADLEINLVHQDQRAELLKTAIDSAHDYNYIIIDCPPTLSLLTVNALTASHYVVIPLQLEVLSIRGLDQIVESTTKISQALNTALKIMGILPVMVDGRKKLSQEVYDYIHENYDLPIFQSHIRTNVRLSEAPSFAKSVLSYSPACNGAKDYTALANEIIEY